MSNQTGLPVHRIWIELEYPSDNTDGDYRAELANVLLRRLGVDYHKTLFWWHHEKKRYCFTIDSAGSFVYCDDNGHWFSLEDLARGSY